MAARKNNSRVINPHDKLIRAVYGDRDNAHSFLTNYACAQKDGGGVFFVNLF